MVRHRHSNPHRLTNKMAAYMVSSSLSARQGYAPSVRVAARAGASPVAVRAPLLVVAKESRIGKHPVQVPKGVTYTLKDNHLSVKGPKGELNMQFPEIVVITEGDDGIKFTRADDSRKAREGHGLYRTLANNMMVGVATGFEKKLKLVGVGYKAAMEGSKAVNLSLGYAHPVILEIPEGLQVKCDSPTEITVSGYDKVEVGNFAAIIRSKRKPEPYKGKGVRYADEVVLIKEGKRK
mmetsp:Transcript_6627/g.29952  ORF Transcript_6627/g.29952 Transcript_6627/m.29952 type:complete len:236 (+) Transcript_6627:36-743(+)